MATTALGGRPARTAGDLPAVGSTAPAYVLTGGDLRDFDRSATEGQRVVLNIFPSIDTPTCARSVRRFNELAASLDGTTVVCVSEDLPFAQQRFCGAEGLESVRVGSAFRGDFGERYGVRLLDSAFAGLLARAVVVLDVDDTVLHTELVPDIGQEPDYDAALAVLG
ncbi:thiol peroxidase [Nocardioides euryhalodurans]|uniref:Thiol peroxidase n=1 Tax=Nocardioides euryhalodurans TaxID=2518370 RepID=A0A4P7GJ60_9ACTN|nr:thiol peroxidase [Nocardioides euryhalodurans]QBR92058.1 thiol peroxidase [Nocardioides euryhalodurans]